MLFCNLNKSIKINNFLLIRISYSIFIRIIRKESQKIGIFLYRLFLNNVCTFQI